MAINAKRRRFIEEYLVDLNATQAALRAGYSARTAHVQGHDILRNPEVSEAIRIAQAERSERTRLTQDWVLRRLTLEAEREGDGSSHSARIQALKLLGDHLGLFREPTPLEQLLASLPVSLGDQLRRALAAQSAPAPDTGSDSADAPASAAR